jgi:hypothetical protein
MNLGIDPGLRRRGIGTRLVQYAIERGAQRGAVRAFLEVRASNQAAIGLYQRLGFRAAGVRARYYTNPTEEAVLMELVNFHQIELRRAAGGRTMLSESRIVELLRESNPEFRALEESHHKLDAELAELQKRHVLTPQEEIVKKQIQKEKLAKKDRMAQLVRQYREIEHGKGQPATERVGT